MQFLYLTGTGFQSKGSYLFGHFSMYIRMVPGDSAGTVTAFYVRQIFLLYYFILWFDLYIPSVKNNYIICQS